MVRVKYSSELYHHGVKGQQWGVKNGPPYPLDSSISNGKELKRFKNSKGSIRKLRKQEQDINNAHYLKKGTKLYRTTSEANEKNEGHTYVTYQKTDRDLYTLWASMNAYEKDMKAYEMTFKAAEDIIVPSNDEVKEVFYGLINKYGDKPVKDSVKDYAYRLSLHGVDPKKAKADYDKIDKDISKVEKKHGIKRSDLVGFRDDEDSNIINFIIDPAGVKTASTYDKSKVVYKCTYDELVNHSNYAKAKNKIDVSLNDYKHGRVTAYELGMISLWSNVKWKEEMIEELSKRGYNAIVDVAGAGAYPIDEKHAGRGGVEPLIIFDRNKTLINVKTREIPKSELYKMYTGYISALNTVDALGARMRIDE